MSKLGRSLWLAVRLALFAVFLSLLGACATTPSSPQSQQPRNVIILFADGAAATQFEFARYTSRALRNAPFAVTDIILKQGTLGLLTTHPPKRSRPTRRRRPPPCRPA